MRMRWRLVTLMAAGSMAVAACGSGGGTTKAASSAPAATTPTTAATVTTAAPSAPVVMTLADNPKFGKILVGSNGHTLYMLEKEQGTTTACTGACAANWPALTASGTPSVGAGITASKVSTASGQLPDQVVYNGHLLYFFARDAAAGDVNGVSIPGWYPVGADGNKVDKS